MVGSGMVQEEERQCEVWDGEIHPHHTQGLLLMGTVRWEEGIVKVCLLQKDCNIGPSCRKGNCIRTYLADMKESFGFEYCCP